MQSRLAVLMITRNRLEYLSITLPALLRSLPSNAVATIWDNDSEQDTRDYLNGFKGHPRISHIHTSTENLKLRVPTNTFWGQNHTFDFLAKVDDDCLVSSDWCEQLLSCHAGFPTSGIIGSWRFYPQDADKGMLSKKIVYNGEKAILQNCWVQGSGYLMRRSVVDRLGLVREGESFPGYCIRAAAAGYLNGFAYPFVFEDHFDDPRSAYSRIKTDSDLRAELPLTAKQFKIFTVDAWVQHQRDEARIIAEASTNPHFYISPLWRIYRRVARMVKALFGQISFRHVS